MDEFFENVAPGLVKCSECGYVFHPKDTWDDEFELVYDDEYYFEQVIYLPVKACRCPAGYLERKLYTKDFIKLLEKYNVWHADYE